MRALLPWARAGGDRLTRDYCHRLGIEVDPPALEALAVAYWLDRAAYPAAHLRRAAARPRLAGGERRGRDSGAAAASNLARWSPMRLRSRYSVADREAAHDPRRVSARSTRCGSRAAVDQPRARRRLRRARDRGGARTSRAQALDAPRELVEQPCDEVPAPARRNARAVGSGARAALHPDAPRTADARRAQAAQRTPALLRRRRGGAHTGGLAGRELVEPLERRPGQRERRYAQRLGGAPRTRRLPRPGRRSR